ncbi:hypothetical protein VNO78_26796 [Psophocarpus tetragonolobus]|uniref:Uncharacterized protein n=1 Tax=Psophocarpus tetragonolobus TaxID=3891 RepID=A0AAN9S0P3_PSOTE
MITFLLTSPFPSFFASSSPSPSTSPFSPRHFPPFAFLSLSFFFVLHSTSLFPLRHPPSSLTSLSFFVSHHLLPPTSPPPSHATYCFALPLPLSLSLLGIIRFASPPSLFFFVATPFLNAIATHH